MTRQSKGDRSDFIVYDGFPLVVRRVRYPAMIRTRPQLAPCHPRRHRETASLYGH